MRLGRPQKLIACVLAALCLANGNVLAQQAGGEISLPVGAIAGKSREGEARASEAKRPAPAAILLKSLVAEALEQNPEIIKQTRSKHEQHHHQNDSNHCSGGAAYSGCRGFQLPGAGAGSFRPSLGAGNESPADRSRTPGTRRVLQEQSG